MKIDSLQYGPETASKQIKSFCNISCIKKNDELPFKKILYEKVNPCSLIAS